MARAEKQGSKGVREGDKMRIRMTEFFHHAREKEKEQRKLYAR